MSTDISIPSSNNSNAPVVGRVELNTTAEAPKKFWAGTRIPYVEPRNIKVDENGFVLISDADINRIAERVIELLKAASPAGFGGIA